MTRFPPALAAAGLKTRMLLQVHDELVFEAPDREVDAVKKLAKDVMESACAPVLSLSVPLVVEPAPRGMGRGALRAASRSRNEKRGP